MGTIMNKNVTRVKTYSIEEIFEFIKNNPSEEYYVDPEGNSCKLRRPKIYFRKGLKCAAKCGCDLTGQYFVLDLYKNGGTHFDLYAKDSKGEEVMMTIDHIHPKSEGGKDIMENYQPMCSPHNSEKSSHIEDPNNKFSCDVWIEGVMQEGSLDIYKGKQLMWKLKRENKSPYMYSHRPKDGKSEYFYFKDNKIVKESNNLDN